MSLAILSTSPYGRPITLPTSLTAALAFIEPNVIIWLTFPYFFWTYSITSGRLLMQKSISTSGMLMRSGFRKRSKRRPCSNGSMFVIPRQ